MKLRFTFGLFFTGLLAFVMMSHSGGRAAQFGSGNTGAPGETSQTCGTCHNGGNFGADLQISVIDADGVTVTQYLPGEEYTLEATINTTTAPGGYGLQLVSLLDSDNTDTEGLSNPSSNAQISSANSRNYLEQAGLSGNETFSATWTAPFSGSGTVTFYGFGHAANGNGSTSGDQSTSNTLSLEEGSPSSSVATQFAGLTLSPNPAITYTNLTWENDMNAQVILYDISGKMILNQRISGTTLRMDLSNIQNGMYFVQIRDTESDASHTVRLVKGN